MRTPMNARSSSSQVLPPISLVALTAVLALGALAPSPARAQGTPTTPWVGERGITETVAEIMERARRNGEPRPWDGRIVVLPEPEVERDGLTQNPGSPP